MKAKMSKVIHRHWMHRSGQNLNIYLCFWKDLFFASCMSVFVRRTLRSVGGWRGGKEKKRRGNYRGANREGCWVMCLVSTRGNEGGERERRGITKRKRGELKPLSHPLINHLIFITGFGSSSWVWSETLPALYCRLLHVSVRCSVHASSLSLSCKVDAVRYDRGVAQKSGPCT